MFIEKKNSFFDGIGAIRLKKSRQSVGVVKKKLSLLKITLKSLFTMAKIKFGLVVVDGRGKLGGHVLAKNRSGNYIRTKTTPTNPQTTFQMAVRGLFASVSSAWSSLTASARQSWNDGVAQFASTDIFGDIKNPSGKALFQKLNQNLSLSGQAQITVCPTPSEVPFANVNAVKGVESTGAFDVDTAGDTTGSRILIFATPQLSQGTSFVKNRLRLIGDYAGGNAVTLDIQSDYESKFSAVSENANIYVGVRVINTNGQASPLETVKAQIFA